MASRGFLIGSVIDDLDAISSQVKTRCSVGQFDLNTHLEIFFRDLLNRMMGWELVSLNEERSNAPGLDLGDKRNRVAVQVTSRTDASKVNKTLKKITDEHRALYDQFYVMMIGNRKADYNLNPTLAKKNNFSQSNLLDLTRLCRTVSALEIAPLQQVHELVSSEQARVRISLEPYIPGVGYKTKATDGIEAVPDIVRSDCSIFQAHETTAGLYSNPAEAAAEIDQFIAAIEVLPRLTRELFGWMIDNSEKSSVSGGEYSRINADITHRKIKGLEDWEGELRILMTNGFLDLEEPDNAGQSPWYSIGFGSARKTELNLCLFDFLSEINLSANTLMSRLDFSAFGRPLDTEE